MNSKGVEKSESIAAEFSKNGFIHLKNVFSEDHCDKLRTQIFNKFDELKAIDPHQADDGLAQSQVFSIPNFWDFLIHEKVVRSLKVILEPEYSLIPNFTVQKNKFGLTQTSIAKIPIPNRHGWHVDSGAEPFDPNHVAPDYQFVKCGLYLQDNDPEFGGGIDVVPGSHKLLFRTGMDRLDGKIRLYKGKLGILFNNKTVPIKKGDVVIFHSFLMHSATHPKGIFEGMTELDKKSAHYSSMPLQKTKLTLYFDACRSRFASPFLKVSTQRAKKELDSVAGDARVKLAYYDQLGFLLGKRYPMEFLEQVKKYGIQFARLEGPDLEEVKRVRQLYSTL
jgi:ectoine hydroxylase-related dioxygenase (phytanoyl-CoA dioxygenase family)